MEQDKTLDLHESVLANDETHVRLCLESGCGINDKNERGETPLRVAVQNESLEVVEVLVDGGASLNEDILYHATRTGNERIIDYLLSHNAPVTYTDQWGSSPLLLAVRLPNPQLTRRMIELGANVHQQNDNGNSVLHEAVIEGIVEHVRILLEHGACVHAENESNETPLHEVARKSCEDGLKMAELLLEKGADPNAVDVDGSTPLLVALESSSSRMIKLLLEHDARIDVRNAMGETALHVAAKNLVDLDALNRLLELDIDLDVKNELDQTALHCAIAAGNSKGCASLLAQGATLYDGSDEDAYYSPLVLALDRLRECAAYEFEDEETQQRKKEVVNVLIRYIAYLMDRRVMITDSDLELIQDNDETRVYYGACSKELRELKREIVHEATSLFDLFDAKVDAMTSHVGNEELMKRFNEVDGDKFPIFYDLIRDKIERTVKKSKV